MTDGVAFRKNYLITLCIGMSLVFNILVFGAPVAVQRGGDDHAGGSANSGSNASSQIHILSVNH